MSDKIAFTVRNVAFAVGGKIGKGVIYDAFKLMAEGDDLLAKYAKMCLDDGCFSMSYNDFAEKELAEYFATVLNDVRDIIGVKNEKH